MEPLARSRDPETVVDKLLELYRQAGNQEYHGEKVSQLEHALQTAQQAVDAREVRRKSSPPCCTTSGTSGLTTTV